MDSDFSWFLPPIRNLFAMRLGNIIHLYSQTRCYCDLCTTLLNSCDWFRCEPEDLALFIRNSKYLSSYHATPAQPNQDFIIQTFMADFSHVILHSGIIYTVTKFCMQICNCSGETLCFNSATQP